MDKPPSLEGGSQQVAAVMEAGGLEPEGSGSPRGRSAFPEKGAGLWTGALHSDPSNFPGSWPPWSPTCNAPTLAKYYPNPRQNPMAILFQVPVPTSTLLSKEHLSPSTSPPGGSRTQKGMGQSQGHIAPALGHTQLSVQKAPRVPGQQWYQRFSSPPRPHPCAAGATAALQVNKINGGGDDCSPWGHIRTESFLTLGHSLMTAWPCQLLHLT